MRRLLATAVFLLACSTSMVGAQEAAGPYVVRVSDTPPGYTALITGGGFDPQQVEVVLHVPGTTLAERPQVAEIVQGQARGYRGEPPPLPATPPEAQTATVQPLHATEHTVFVELPHRLGGTVLPPGYVAILWLREGERLSNPALVNAPDAWFLLKRRVRAGELNRLIGCNLRGDQYQPRYLFLRPVEGGEPQLLPEVPLRLEDGFSEQFSLQFKVPEDLAPGEYEVFAHNNSGRLHGFTHALRFTVTDLPDFPVAFYNAAEHGVRGDSVTDNSAPLQQLLDLVGAAGGGTVFLPPGTYRLTETLQLREHTVLRGAGRESTTLFYQPDPGHQRRYLWLISARDVNHTGLEDLTVRDDYQGGYGLSYYAAGDPLRDLHIRRCRFVDAMVSVHFGVNLEIADCSFERSVLHITNLRDSWIHDNEFTMGRLGGSPVGIWAMEHSVFERNRAYGSNRGFVWQIHGAFGHYRNLIDANVVEGARLGANAGETFLFEGAGFKWYGQPTSVQPDGFTVAGADWEPDALRWAFAVVTQGRGLGQYVRIAGNTAEQVRLERPWPILPGGDVRISILCGVVENAFVNNRDVHCDNTMMWYSAGAIANWIVRNRSENSLGFSMWSHAEMAQSLLVPDYFNLFSDNVLEDQGSFWCTILGDISQSESVRNLGNIFRRNFVADSRRKRENQYDTVWEERHWGTYRPVQAAFWFDIGRSYLQDRTRSPLWLDALVERNYVTRCDWGVELRPSTAGVVVQRNTFFEVKLPVIDQGAGNVVTGNVVEYAVLEDPPPPAEVDRGAPER